MSDHQHKKFIAWHYNDHEGYGIVGEEDTLEELVKSVQRTFGYGVDECIWTETIQLEVKIVRKERS